MTRTHSIRAVLKLAKTCRLNLSASVLFTLVLSFGFASGQHADMSAPVHTTEDKQLTARLERSIPKLMEQGDIPGLSIALIRDAEVIWSRGLVLRIPRQKKQSTTTPCSKPLR